MRAEGTENRDSLHAIYVSNRKPRGIFSSGRGGGLRPWEGGQFVAELPVVYKMMLTS